MTAGPKLRVRRADGRPFIDSRDLADFFGRTHSSMLRSIRDSGVTPDLVIPGRRTHARLALEAAATVVRFLTNRGRGADDIEVRRAAALAGLASMMAPPAPPPSFAPDPPPAAEPPPPPDPAPDLVSTLRDLRDETRELRRELRALTAEVAAARADRRAREEREAQVGADRGRRGNSGPAQRGFEFGGSKAPS